MRRVDDELNALLGLAVASKLLPASSKKKRSRSTSMTRISTFSVCTPQSLALAILEASRVPALALALKKLPRLKAN